ncbi:unnamed protein product [Ilex paraguariensis]|uniref:Uncharacterized protein n=1 Tax=Ilex paraguariensis TaxID=185542 RepID=A0ABC8SMA2_9AQUA
MMGVGYLGSGGPSSSSSNLSALAPPFTVDRSNPKSNSNPLVHFNDSLYAAPFNQTWVYPYSTAPRPDFVSNPDLEVDSIRTTSLPLANDNGYPGSGSINPSGHWSTLHPTAKTGRDAFSYSVEAKPYCHPYVLPMVDDDSPLVAINEPSYDLLSTSGHSRLNVSPQVDYTQSLSPLEYKPQWSGFWTGLADAKRSKRIELDGSSYSEEKNGSGSHVYKPYIKQGARTDEGRSKCGEDFAISQGKCTDAFGIANSASSLSIGILDGNSFFSKNISFIPFESSRMSLSGAGSVFTESLSQAPSLETASNSIYHQKPYTPHQKHDSFMDDCMTVITSSSAVLVGPPTIGTTTLAPNTVSPKTLDSGNNAAVYHGDFNSINFAKGKEPQLPIRSDGKEDFLATNKPSFLTERSEHICVESSSTKVELSNKQLHKDAPDHKSKARSGCQVPDINIIAVFDGAGVKSTESSSDGLEHHNPAVDSPCWKGAPGVHFPPFEVLEATTQQHLTKNLEAQIGLNIHESQIFTPFNDSVKFSSSKSCEIGMHNQNWHIDDSLSLSPKRNLDDNCLVKEQRSGDAVKADDFPNLSSNIRVLCSDDIDKPRKEYDFPHGDSCVKSRHTKQLNPEEENFTCTKLKLRTGVEDSGMNSNDASEDGRVPLHVVENVLSSPSSGEDTSELVKLHGRERTPTMGIQMLVNALRNLSELLLFHCSNDMCRLKEQDYEALRNVTNTLGACMSMKMVNAMPTGESSFPQQGPFHKIAVSPDLHLGASASQPQMRNKAAANLLGRLDFQHTEEEKRNNNISGKKAETFQGFVSLRDDAEVSNDGNMVQVCYISQFFSDQKNMK